MSLRVDPEQRFACSQCGKCCHRWEVVVSDAELELYRRHNAAGWTDDGGDPFERLPGQARLHTIRKRSDGACVFLTADNKCRIHLELGGTKKPLTCRLFPYSFHAASDATIVAKASFACPTIVANQGPLIAAAASLDAIESLRKEWGAIAQPRAGLELIAGRPIEPRSARMLRDNLLKILKRDEEDIRVNIRRIAETLDDLTRSRVVALGEAEFSEYLSLTVPHAATTAKPPAARDVGAMARMLQYGFLYTVLATRLGLEYPQPSRTQLRMRRVRLLAHFHGLAPRMGPIDVKALSRRRVDINAPDIRPVVYHYLRSTLETLGTRERPIVDALAIQVSYLNAARSLAAMKADATGRDVTGAIFGEAVMEAADLSHATSGLLGQILNRFAAGTEALWRLAS